MWAVTGKHAGGEGGEGGGVQMVVEGWWCGMGVRLSGVDEGSE